MHNGRSIFKYKFDNKKYSIYLYHMYKKLEVLGACVHVSVCPSVHLSEIEKKLKSHENERAH